MDERNLETRFYDDETAALILTKEREKDPRPDVCPKLIEQIGIDEKIAIWRKNWSENHGCYNNGVDMPPPIYDEDLSTWVNEVIEASNFNIAKVDKQHLLSFYNATQIIKIIELNEAARKSLEEWRKSDEYKKMQARWKLNDE